MRQDDPKVQVKNVTPFGVQYSELNTDHNQAFGYGGDWAFSLLQRLSFSPRLEVAIADCILWVSTSALVTSLGITAVSLGVHAAFLAWIGVLLLLPVGLWAHWVNTQLEPVFKDITGLRLTLVLSGVAIALLFGVWVG